MVLRRDNPPPTERDEEEAGAREAFEDAILYDFEYRRRRADVNFYRRIAEERLDRDRDVGPGPILDLACGSGRLLAPLLRDGHTVVGVDLSASMLERAAWRVSRLSAARRRRALLVRADLRALALGRKRFALAICAFHSLQHLIDDRDLRRCLQGIRAALRPDGWLAFDLLPPDPRWIHRDPERRWARTRFRHPGTGQQLLYSTTQRFDPGRRALHMRLHYQPLDRTGRPDGPERVVRLCHRQLEPREVGRFLEKTGWELLSSFGGFDGRPLAGTPGEPPLQHIYVARPRRRSGVRSASSPTVRG